MCPPPPPYQRERLTLSVSGAPQSLSLRAGRERESGPFENQPSISGAPQGPISGTPSGFDQDQLWAANECRTAKLQDTIEARGKVVDGL